MVKAVLLTFKTLVLYLAISIASLLMLSMIIDYASFETDIHFLRSKQGYLQNTTWTWAFYIHVFTAIIPLVAGLTQFSPYLLRTNKGLHRTAGKIYILAILLINFPTGLILAINANGYLPTKLAFLLLDCLWFYFTLRAWLEIKKGNITAHKNFMLRSYALTFSAITLRSWKIILPLFITIDPLTLYQLDAWLGFVPNLFIAEWLIRRSHRSKEKKYISSK